MSTAVRRALYNKLGVSALTNLLAPTARNAAPGYHEVDLPRHRSGECRVSLRAVQEAIGHANGCGRLWGPQRRGGRLRSRTLGW